MVVLIAFDQYTDMPKERLRSVDQRLSCRCSHFSGWNFFAP